MKMSSSPKPPLPRDNRYSLQPARTYEVPGGPYAKDLGSIDVLKLAEIVRGGPDDNVR